MDRLTALLAPPYDVISRAERVGYAARDPHNIVHLILPEAPSGADQYADAAARLTAWRREGVLRRDPGEAADAAGDVRRRAGGTLHDPAGAAPRAAPLGAQGGPARAAPGDPDQPRVDLLARPRPQPRAGAGHRTGCARTTGGARRARRGGHPDVERHRGA